MGDRRLAFVFLILTSLIALPANAARITWKIKLSTGPQEVSSEGTLIEACNFGNEATSSPSINGITFTPINFADGQSPNFLIGLSYNTGESGKYPGNGINELFDTIAYQSGINPQQVELTNLTIGQNYLIQFFYYHNNVDRSLSIRDDTGSTVTLTEQGTPVIATGSFTADSQRQRLTLDASVGSQFLNAYQFRAIQAAPPPRIEQVIISEFMASNDGTLLDSKGESSDWIEIWNATSGSVDLLGWELQYTGENDFRRWTFPSIILAADQRIILFASTLSSQELPTNEIHTGFTLEKNGGTLSLLKPQTDGTFTTLSELTYPPQRSDISYGLISGSDPSRMGYLLIPTPGSRNTDQGYEGFVDEVRFDSPRGFYPSPFTLSLSTQTPEARILYTTDGSIPSVSNSEIYHQELGLPITTTTTLRAIAYREGFVPSQVATHTYLFTHDVVNQRPGQDGPPSTWPGADYEMEQDPNDLALIAGDPQLSLERAKQIISDALQELPALSLVMNQDDWFGATQGIYANSTGRGMAWERACSAELITPDHFQGDSFQVNCGVRIQGNTSRNTSANPKHSLRLLFREQYGAPKLRYPLFGEDDPNEFDTIVLRSNSQDAWVYQSSRNRMAQFVRDNWAREIHRRMGHASPDSTWVHLFINGLYWGVYNPTERPDASHGASYYGASKENWDSIKNHEEVLDGNSTAYQELLSLIQNNPNNWSAGYRDLSSLEDYRALSRLIDMEMLADYMIHNMYAAADDWPGNFYMGYDRTGASGGWRFFDWDNEHGMKNPVTLDRTLPHSRDSDSPTKFHHALKANPEYRLLFADRLHRAFFNGGVLSVDPSSPQWNPLQPQNNQPAALWMELTQQIQTALIAESARWGDFRRDTPYTVSIDFENVRNDLLQNWFPQRSQIVFEQFKSQNLYPEIDAPELSQFGGLLDQETPITITAPDAATVYYTVDGSDPRQSPDSLEETLLVHSNSPFRYVFTSQEVDGQNWKNPSFDDSSWEEGRGSLGFELIASTFQDFITTDATAMFGTSSGALLRFDFELSVDQLKTIDSLHLKLRFDDGMSAYLNGVLVAQSNSPVTPTWDSTSTTRRSDNLAILQETFDLSLLIGQLKEGENSLAIHGLNDSLTGSDFLIQPELSFTGGQQFSATAKIYDGDLYLDSSVTLKARSLVGTEWSALTEANFDLGSLANSENLIISEIMYHAEGGSSLDYLELMNTSADEQIHLGGVRFLKGIEFEFPHGIDLLAGERIVLVRDLAAFQAHYGPGIRIAGQFSGNLDNGGERLYLVARDGMTIQDFSFDDNNGWSRAADGFGPSLVLIEPESKPNPSLATNWRSSPDRGGTPGSSDVTEFNGSPNLDQDGDNLPALLEYALGSSDHNPSDAPPASIRVTPQEGVLVYQRNLLAEDISLHIDYSSDLQTWRPLLAQEFEESRGAEEMGRATINVRLLEEVTSSGYYRLRAVLKK